MSDSALLRSQIARSLVQVRDKGRTIDWLGENKAAWVDTPLARELLYGTIRHFYSLHAHAASHLQKPLRNKDNDVMYLMLVGAYQLQMLDLPDRVVINETVEACNALRKPWAKGLVNAVLRNISRTPLKNPKADPEQSFDHPLWLIEKLRQQYPDNTPAPSAEALLLANNQRAPMCLRINTSKISVADYRKSLQANHIATAAHPYTSQLPEAVVLSKPQAADTLPGWSNGHVAVQDLGAQAAALLWSKFAAPENTAMQVPGANLLRTLDACAAPGGKLFHMLERLQANPVSHQVTALELSERRAENMLTISRRLGHNLQPEDGGGLQVADAAADPDLWWDGRAFHHILIDAPCSGTGTLRRHPDIKLLLRAPQIQQHAQSQLELLRNLWRTLAPGGTLLYCTCSLLEEENDRIVQAFLDDHTGNGNLNAAHSNQAQAPAVVPVQLPSGFATRHGWQLTPLDAATDGFYYALLRKPI